VGREEIGDNRLRREEIVGAESDRGNKKFLQSKSKKADKGGKEKNQDAGKRANSSFNAGPGPVGRKIKIQAATLKGSLEIEEVPMFFGAAAKGRGLEKAGKGA